MQAKINLLIVEDEALIAQELTDTLHDLGYHVLATCHSYAEAQQAFARHQPDLVLLDINLRSANPTHNGLALAQLLREQAAPPPFVFLSAYDDPDTMRQAARLQPSGYLVKPANDAALFAAIQTALARHAAQQPAPLPDPAAPSPAPADFFFVKSGFHLVPVPWHEVASLEAGKNYVSLRAPALHLTHALRGSLTHVLDHLLPPALRGQFLRVNRGVVLNTRFITGYDAALVQCGGEAYENGGLVEQQLRQLLA